MTLGIGSGGEGWDASVLGSPRWTRRERADRFAEFVELTDRLLREPEVTHDGRFYSADGARNYPGCVQKPRIPFAVAAAGPRAMVVAATFADTWVTTGDRGGRDRTGLGGRRSRRTCAQMDLLDAACAWVGRDPASVSRLALSGLRLESGLDSAAHFDDTVGRYEAAGVTDFVVHWPRPVGPFKGEISTFERIFSRHSP